MNLRIRCVTGMLVMSLWPLLGLGQADELHLDGGQLTAGASGTFRLYLRDVAGSGIDTGVENIGGVLLKMQVTPGTVDSVSITADGLSAGHVFFENTTFMNDEIHFQLIYQVAGVPFFSLGASAPGDPIATMTLTAAAGAGGQTISFTPVASDTAIQDELGTTINSVANGKLIANLGSIAVQSSGGNDPPVINSFTASPGTIVSGNFSTLSWAVTDADTVSINQGIGSVAASGSQQVSPTTSTTYTLTATNEFGQSQRSVTVAVTSGFDPPTIESFTATPSTINAGESSTLAWSVTDATEVSIDQSVGVVSESGSLSVQPVATTTYTLTATNGFGSSTEQATVTVASGVQILFFTAEPDAILRGEASTLSWETAGAKTVVLNPGSMQVDKSGSLDVMPEESTEYSLRATSDQGAFTTAIRQVTVFDTDIELIVSNDAFDFGSETDSMSVDLSASNVASIDWTASGYPEWLTINPSSGQTGAVPTRITLSPDRKEFYPNEIRTGTVEISASGVPPITLSVRAQRREHPDNGAALFFPRVTVDDAWQSVLTVVNTENATGKLEIQIFNAMGEMESQTRNIHFPPFGSYRRTLPAMDTSEGWIAVTATYDSGVSGTARIHGSLVVRSLDGEELWASTPATSTFEELFVPHIAKDAAFYTSGSVVNMSPDSVVDFTSAVVGTIMVDSLDSGELTTFDFRELMGGEILGPGWGRLESSSTEPALAGIEVFGRAKQTMLRQSVAVGLDGATANELLFTHIAADVQSFWTGIVIINTSNSEQQVTIQAYDAAGFEVGSAIVESYTGSEKRTYLITGDQLPFGSGAAWIRVTSPGALVGYELFGTYDDRFAGFESVRSLSTTLALPHLEEASRAGGWTGMAAVNPGGTTAQLTISHYNRLGVLQGQVTRTLGQGEKLVALVATLLNEPIIEAGDWVLVQSDQAIAGFELFGFGQSTLAAILAGTTGPQ